MDLQQFDDALRDLETRVDRLRALYENWFRGYEKTEPMVARKDVERRVYGLRKVLPRNTALRFRYHQLYQRYTTLTSYWQRTSRQIEEGTYRLQLQRLRRRQDKFGAGRERLEHGDLDIELDAQEPQEPRAYDLDLDANLDVNELLDDFELDEVARALETPGPHREPPRPRPSRAVASFSRPRHSSSVPAAAFRPMVETRPSSPPPSELAGQAGRVERPAPASSLAATVPPAPQRRATASLAQTSPPPPRHAGSAASAARAPGPPPSAKGPVPPPPPLAAQRTLPGVGASVPRPALPQPGPGRPSAPNNTLPMPVASGRAPAQSGQTLVGRPPPAPPQVPAGGPSEARLRQVFTEYLHARRKNNEADVRYETLANSIQRMLPELQKKHTGKRIDFEVVVKNGRVGLKPKAF